MLTFKQLEPALHKWAKYFQNKRFQHWELVSAVWLMGRIQQLERIQFASARVRYDMIEYMRKETDFRRVKPPKTHSFSSLNDEKLTFEEIIGKKDNRFGWVDTKDLFEILTVGLTRQAKLAVNLRFKCDYPQSEIARIIDVSPSRISQILNNSLKIIKAKLVAFGEIDSSRIKKAKVNIGI